jgi:hypothetical protein
VTAAIFGLIGVVVGALLATAREYFMAWRQERAAVRANSRLVTLDLKRAREAFEDRQGRQSKAGSWAGDLSLNDWRGRLDFLARSMPDDDWDAVADAFIAVERIALGIASTWEPDMRRDTAVKNALLSASGRIGLALTALGDGQEPAADRRRQKPDGRDP